MFLQEYSQDSIVIFGGDTYTNTTTNYPFSIWELTVSDGDGTWTQLHNPTDPIWEELTWPRSPVSSSPGWSIGGFALDLENGTQIPLLSMSIVNTTLNTFTQVQNIGQFTQNGGINQGEAQFVPMFGTGEGLVVVLGGQSIGNSTVGSTFNSMNNIMLFDPKTQQCKSS